MTSVVERYIHALFAKRKQEEEALGWKDKMAGAIIQFVRSMNSFICTWRRCMGFGLRLILGGFPALIGLILPFVVLAMEASVEAICLSTLS